MELREDGWLAGLFGHPVFRVEVRAADDGPETTERLRRHAGEQAAAFYYAKVDTAEVARVRRLLAAGFAVVDVNVVFDLTRPPFGKLAVPADLEVGDAEPTEERAVLAIAESAFRFSRFHLDPQVSTALANRIKRDWVANYFARQRGDRLLAARRGGRPVGFLAALLADRTAVIDLIAVATDAQRSGVGEALVGAFADGYASAAGRIVGTQVANIPSTRFYEKLGFSLRQSQYVLHLHVG